ncbi:MAG: guanylate kinase [Dehalococcoidia bacterium]|nr:guanylate kinase [Dehalococcoidia bacterium]
MIKDLKTGPLLIVISGPSGVGKDAVIQRMKELNYPFHYVVTATTRPKRPTETDGVHYHFLTDAEFKKLMRENGLIEWAQVYGNYYGVPRREVEKALMTGKDTVVKVDVQGAATIKKLVPDAVFIFLMPPSIEDLKQRLSSRNSESSSDRERRLAKVEEEVSTLPMFDYVVVNYQDRLNETIEKIAAIVTAEHARVHPRVVKL